MGQPTVGVATEPPAAAAARMKDSEEEASSLQKSLEEAAARCGTCPLCKRHELAPEDAELAIHWDIDFAKMEWSIARVTPACLCSPAPAMACPLCRSALHAPASREGKGSLKPSIVRSHCREVGDADALLNAMLQVSDAAGEVAFAGLAAHLLAANGLGKERGEAVQAALNATHAVKVVAGNLNCRVRSASGAVLAPAGVPSECVKTLRAMSGGGAGGGETRRKSAGASGGGGSSKKRKAGAGDSAVEPRRGAEVLAGATPARKGAGGGKAARSVDKRRASVA